MAKAKIFKGNKEARLRLRGVAEYVYSQLKEQEIPHLEVSSRTKNNIVLSRDHKVWKYGKDKVTRSAKDLGGATSILRSLYTIDFIDEMIRAGKSSTLREMYYISEGWNRGKFPSQDESNRLAEDLEIITKCMREDFKLRPEEDGARVIGDLTIEETNRKGDRKKINCKDDVGDSGYGIPYNVEAEKLKFKSVNADMIIAIETGGMFDRLAENGFDESHRAILVHLKGQPARSTRRFIKRLHQHSKLPVVIFTDGDPWSYRIFASVAYGAIKTAHISEYLSTPEAIYLGITPSDIINYELPSDKLTDQDVNALKSELSDPRFSSDRWRSEIKLQLKIRKKSEQQALAKYGLDYVTDTYLPEKLAELNIV
ncbi:MAG TPA: DNA topoisomerase IV subunit A [Euryarchaeota archaeon]|nr:MAG: DNA topoisomerase VI [Thermoplasmatales archaeon ex4484_6]RLF68990.1 MAG: DNA topoisomerase VI [Thermoplasmata archaeon]HHD15930.1 DNA topoisomerase IV subunit A [Euryarchaeota archaeon]